ncbi:YbaB/EbfC family nucleoid-associated protein [Glycomyces sp. NRRL B-16210]|uniref:YbaB/EbfC family nucleoid-associated protein n=1 Tax=Glycomyces sp. NRRL B-16210 TaxID=1463821 RepID=UPI0004C207C3|nr:YbaB/EbfC family nucleoid-associated protein [Glycomyces sp. NRRL B-16210]
MSDGRGPAEVPNLDQMMARLDQMQREAEQTLAKFEELHADMEEVEAVSEDGLISVRLDADGQVVHIGIDERAMRHRQTLGRAVLAVVAEANAAYGVQMSEMAQALNGGAFDVKGMFDRYMPEHVRDRADRTLGRD